MTSSAATTSVSEAVNAKFKIVQTDTHSIIMRQIMGLQTQLKDLYVQLRDTPPVDIQARIELQRQIQGIEDEISALQGALISTENKKVMEQRAAEAEKSKAGKQDGVKAPAPTLAKAFAVAPASAAARPAAVAPAGSAAADPADPAYASDGQAEASNAESVGANVDVMA